MVATVWGANGNCTIPSGATGVSLAVVVVSPTAPSFLTVFPPDHDRPLSSNLNWQAGQAPTPNAVTASLSADGKLALYNLAGTVNVVVDVVGYYEVATSGPPGPPGPKGDKGDQGLTGPKGDTGDPGPRPANVVWVAKSGGDFTSLSAALASITDNSDVNPYLIRIAPGTYTESSFTLLKDWVDVEGSGQDRSVIICDCATAAFDYSSAVLAAVGAGLHLQVRDMTVVNTGGGGTFSIAIGTDSVSSTVSFDHITATGTGGNVSLGVFSAGSPSAPVLTNSTVTVGTSLGSRNAIYFLTPSQASITNVTAIANGGVGVVFADGGNAVFIRDSNITGVISVSGGPTGVVRIADTVLNGFTQLIGAANCDGTVTPALAPFTCN